MDRNDLQMLLDVNNEQVVVYVNDIDKHCDGIKKKDIGCGLWKVEYKYNSRTYTRVFRNEDILDRD